MKKQIAYLLVFIFLFTTTAAYEDFVVSNEQLESGYTAELSPGDKFIYEIDGEEYKATVLQVTMGSIQISVSENERQNLYLESDHFPREMNFELTFDNDYDLNIKLNEINYVSPSEKSASITIRKIDEAMPEDATLIYSCAKFYICPNGERVRYTEMVGQGCAILAPNPFQLCDAASDRPSCHKYYTCPGGERVKECEEVGQENTFSHGCECIDNPESLCPEDTCTKYYTCPNGDIVKECEPKTECVSTNTNGGAGGGCGVKCECVENPSSLCIPNSNSQIECNEQSPCPGSLVCAKFPNKENPVCTPYPPTDYYDCPSGTTTLLDPINPEQEGSPFRVVCQDGNEGRCPLYFDECPGTVVNEGLDENGCEIKKCKMAISTGEEVEIKITPERAKEKATEALAESNLEMTLKENPYSGTPLSYHYTTAKEARVFGIFKTTTTISAEVDVETGEVKVKKPWWSFLATGV